MTEFDNREFERLMAQAVEYRREGNFKLALEIGALAYELAPPDSLEQGRAARDNSFAAGKLNHVQHAVIWADRAYMVHTTQLQEDRNRETYREHAASAMALGVAALRWAAQGRREYDVQNLTEMAQVRMREAGTDLVLAGFLAEGVNRWVDQYSINAARRRSVAESLGGEQRRGKILALQAIGLAFLSESPRLDTSNPNLSPVQRRRAKTRALLGGVTALAVSFLASEEQSEESSPRQDLAWKLAEKVL